MTSQELHRVIEAMKVLSEALSQTDETSNEVKDALSEVSLFLSGMRLGRTVNQGMADDDSGPIDFFEQALDAVEHAGAAIPAATDRLFLHLELGEMTYKMGKWDESLIRFEEALRLGESENDRAAQAHALRQIGRLKRRRGHWKSATEALERAAELYHGLNDAAGEAEARLNLGNIAFEQGNYDEAEKIFRHALEIAQTLDEMRANINLSLGTIHQVRGKVYEAIEHYTDSRDAFDTVGDHRRKGHVCLNLGVSYRDSGGWRDSGVSLEEGLKLARKTRDLGTIGMIYLRRAESQMMLWDITMAMVYARRAMRIFTRLGDPLGQADTYRLYGRAAWNRGVWTQAEDYLTESVRLHQEYECPLGEAEAVEEWGWMYESKGDREQAIESFKKAEEMFRKLGAENDAQRIEETLDQLNGSLVI